MSAILGLDIGTEFVKAVLARPTKSGKLEILGIGKAKQPSGSMHAGAIADIPAVVATCEDAIFKVEEAAEEHAELTVVGIAGELIKGNTTTVRYSRKSPHTPITEQEMQEIIKQVQRKSGAVARDTVALETGNSNVEVRLISSAIVALTIDGYKISNPIGFKGTDVVIQFYTAFAPMIHVAAIEKVCAELNLDLLTIAVEPFAVCRACLGDDLESNFSSIIIDVGGGTTDLAVIEDGGVESTKMFSIGGRSFTRQIEESLGVDFDTAESYKLNYDSLTLSDDSENPSSDNGPNHQSSPHQPIDPHASIHPKLGSRPSAHPELDPSLAPKLTSAIDHSLSVWLTGIEVALEDFDSSSSLPRHILLCGGGASLTPLQETLALSNWYQNLPFSRRPVIHLLDVAELPDLDVSRLSADSLHTLDHSFATALGLLRVGTDTIAGSPSENKLRSKISKLLQN